MNRNNLKIRAIKSAIAMMVMFVCGGMAFEAHMPYLALLLLAVGAIFGLLLSLRVDDIWHLDQMEKLHD